MKAVSATFASKATVARPAIDMRLADGRAHITFLVQNGMPVLLKEAQRCTCIG